MAAVDGVSIEDMAFQNLAPSIQQFLTSPDIALGWITQQWTLVVDANDSLLAENLLQLRYRLLANFAMR